jgi:phenylacetic acid degradation protein
MNAVVTDGVIVGESSFIGAAAYVKAGTIIPPRSLVVGVPAKVVRELNDQEIAWKKEATAVYQALAQRSIESLKVTEARTTVESNRKRIPKLPLDPLYQSKQG